jgi:hypothetical protein
MEEVVESGLIQQKLATELGDIEQKDTNLRDIAEKIQQKLLKDLKGNAEIVTNRLESELDSFRKAVTQTIRSLRVSLNDSSARVASGLAAIQISQAKLAEIDAKASDQMSKGREQQWAPESTLRQRVISLENSFDGLKKQLQDACNSLQSSNHHLEVSLTALSPTEVRVKVHNRRFYSIKEAKIRAEMDGRVVYERDLPLIRGSSDVTVAIQFAEEHEGKRLQLTAMLNGLAISTPKHLV